MMFTAAVLTVSDKGAKGLREDTGGPLVCQLLEQAGYTIAYTAIVPDERDQIEQALIHAADDLGVALVITTGGTGFSPRDITPEATIAVCDRMAPGLAEAMRYESLKITNRAMLSRAQAGIRKRCLIVNLPGSPKAIRENLAAIESSLGHGLEVLRGQSGDCAKTDHV